jgi:hypothetical protein
MINSDKPNFASMLTATLEIYNVKVNPMVISIWWKTLERFEFLVVEQAFTAHVTDTDVGHFSPKPASILQNIEGSRETRAMMAWAKVEKAVRRIGAGDTVVFDDEVIHATLDDMGGWIKLCSCELDEMPFRANEFSKRYNALAKHGFSEYPRKLIGKYETTNLANGFVNAIAAPVTIGEVEKCRLVFKQGSTAQGLINRAPILITDNSVKAVA